MDKGQKAGWKYVILKHLGCEASKPWTFEW